jgi:hypothetical protein
MALIEMRMIQTEEDLPAFAQSLYGCSLFLGLYSHADGPISSVKKTAEEQTELLAKLDAHGASRTGSR